MNKWDKIIILVFFLLLSSIVVALYTETGIRISDNLRLTISPAGSATTESSTEEITTGQAESATGEGSIAGAISFVGLADDYGVGLQSDGLYYLGNGAYKESPYDLFSGWMGVPLSLYALVNRIHNQNLFEVSAAITKRAADVPNNLTTGGSMSQLQDLFGTSLPSGSSFAGSGGASTPRLDGKPSGSSSAGAGTGTGYSPTAPLGDVVAPVPEASTFLLAGVGLIVIGLLTRVFRKRQV